MTCEKCKGKQIFMVQVTGVGADHDTSGYTEYVKKTHPAVNDVICHGKFEPTLPGATTYRPVDPENMTTHKWDGGDQAEEF